MAVNLTDWLSLSRAGVLFKEQVSSLQTLLEDWFVTKTGGDFTGAVNGPRFSATAPEQVSLASADHPLTVGEQASFNLAFDANTIQSRNNGATLGLTLQQFGGSLNIGSVSASSFVNLFGIAQFNADAPTLTLQDTNGAGTASTASINLRDSAGSLVGQMGNLSSGTDDMNLRSHAGDVAIQPDFNTDLGASQYLFTDGLANFANNQLRFVGDPDAGSTGNSMVGDRFYNDTRYNPARVGDTSLPAALNAVPRVRVSNISGLVYSDDTNWRRASDGVIVA